jgi:hypothetical protein
MFSLRASEDTLKEAIRLSKIAKVDKSLVLREALEKGLEKIKIETGIKLFSEGKLSIPEATNRKTADKLRAILNVLSTHPLMGDENTLNSQIVYEDSGRYVFLEIK